MFLIAYLLVCFACYSAFPAGVKYGFLIMGFIIRMDGIAGACHLNWGVRHTKTGPMIPQQHKKLVLLGRRCMQPSMNDKSELRKKKKIKKKTLEKLA